MPWLALTLEVERAAADAFSDALLEAGAQSVALEAAGRMVALVCTGEDSAALVARAAGTTRPNLKYAPPAQTNPAKMIA